MRPTLEYASSTWSPLASSTSISKLQVIQNAHTVQTYNTCMTKHSHFPYTSTYSSTPHNSNIKHNIHLISYTNMQHTSILRGLKTILNNAHDTSNIPTHPYTGTTTYLKRNMRHIPTWIVSRHLATRGNIKILRTHSPHINSSEEILSRLTGCTFTQLRTNKSPFLKLYLHNVDAKSHPSPTYEATLSPLDFWTEPTGVTALLARWTEKLAGGPQTGRSDSPH